MGSGHHLRPDRIEPGAPYFGKSLPVRPLSLPEFLQWCLLSRRLCFVICFGKLSLSDIPIRNNQTMSDQVSTVAKVPSKWRSRRKRTEFRPCWRVKCGMSLHHAGNIQLRVLHRPIDLQMCWRFPYICSCCDGCIEEDGTNYAPPVHPTPSTNLPWMRGFFIYRVGIFTCSNTGILRINVSRQVKPPKKFRLWQWTYWQGLSKYGMPGSILSGHILWPPPAHVMMSSHFLHNEVSPLQILLQYPH